MTARTAARPLALLAAVAILIAACGGGTPSVAPGATATAAPATAAPATAAPATPAPATAPPASAGSGTPSFAVPSFHADLDLEALLPAEIDGVDLTVLSMSGAEFASTSPELTAMLGTLGKSTSDLSVAFGGSDSIAILAFQVDGVPGATILNALFGVYQQDDGTTITDASFGGKSVKKLTPVDPEEYVSYIYTTQDVVFVVGGEDVSDAVLGEVFAKLP